VGYCTWRDDLRGGAGPHLGSVFVEGNVADIVLAVFSAPMFAVEGQDVGWVGLPGGKAGGCRTRLVAFAQWVAVQVERLACHRPGPVGAGEFGCATRGGRDRPDLIAAAVKRDVGRGKAPFASANRALMVLRRIGWLRLTVRTYSPFPARMFRGDHYSRQVT
jgi:hypothetical protein